MPAESVSGQSASASAATSNPRTNYRWIICALLFFSTTVNYMDRGVISYLKEYFCAPLESSPGFSTVSSSSLNLPVLADRLNRAADPVSQYVKSNLSAPTLAALQDYHGGDSVVLRTNLVRDLNAVIGGQSIYNPQRFAGVALDPESQKVMAANPSGDALPHFNRLLLDDAFPRAITPGGFGWTDSDYSYLTAIFTGMYAVTTIFAGWFIDKIGTKLGLALSLIVWSIFGIANAFIGSLVWMHCLIRSCFAVGEAGNFPASIKTVAEWFPKRERALATAIFNGGSNAGAMVAAIFVPTCLIWFGDAQGWKWAFILTGASGFLWLIFWFWLYNPPAKHPKVSQSEIAYIRIDDETAAETQAGDQAKVPWFALFRYRQIWSFVVGKFMTDGIWWFYLFWLPDYLKKQFHMTTGEVRLPTFIVFGVSILGSIYGSSIPLTLIKRGTPVYKARMMTMFVIALLPLAVLLTQYFGDVSRFGGAAAGLAVAMIAIGCTAHQAWSANLFTTVSDMFPKKAIGSVVGIGTASGGLGGVIIQLLKGKLGDHFSQTPQTGYFIMFIVCALSYLIAWVFMKALVPRHKPITDL